jgi:hypothetical protein
MKLGLILVAAAASVFATSAVNAAPFASRQSVVATKTGYQSIQYNIKNNDVRNGIKIPVTNRPVHMMVTDITPYYQGIGDVTLVANPGTQMIWIGADYEANASGTATVDHGSAQNKGAHIMWVGGMTTVDVEVQNETTIQIRNTSGEAQAVIVTFTW